MLSSTIIFGSPLPPIENLPKVSVWHFLFGQHNESFADTTAYVDEDGYETYSHAAVCRLTKSIAHVLLNNFGLQRGDTIIVYSENTVKYPIVLLATQAAGLVCSPASAAYQTSELKYQILDSQAKLVLVSHSKYETALTACVDAGISKPALISSDYSSQSCFNAAPNIWDMQDGSELHVAELLAEQAEQTTALLCYSSGTSGRPKGVKTSHYNLTSAILQMQALSPLSYGPQEVWIACLPLSHIYGLMIHILAASFTGATIVVMKKFILDKYAAMIEGFRVTASHIVPPIAVRMAKELHKMYDFSSLREWRSGAAPLGQDFSDLLYTRFKVPLHAIYVKGPNIMLGYHNRPDANKEAFDEDGFLCTGDVVRLDEDGSIFVIDRVKEIIKYNGYQVPPAELEDILVAHSAVKDAAVVGIPDALLGTEIPIAFGDSSMLYPRVAHYKHLRGIVFAHSIPKSASDSGMGIPLDKAKILAIFLETLLYGIFFTLFWLTLLVLILRGDGGQTQRRQLVPLGTVMMVIATAHLIIDFVRVVEAFVAKGNSPIDANAYYEMISHPLHVVKTALYVTQTIIGDAVVVSGNLLAHLQRKKPPQHTNIINTGSAGRSGKWGLGITFCLIILQIQLRFTSNAWSMSTTRNDMSTIIHSNKRRKHREDQTLAYPMQPLAVHVTVDQGGEQKGSSSEHKLGGFDGQLELASSETKVDVPGPL
ncbi:putative NRPS-like protein biosynthetic cluster [Pleurotus pulmonarius]|nr:putative NRPS-like protein biosynthetic cluster [Pleurotus pulmonarius]